jgi:hypothetical protein
VRVREASYPLLAARADEAGIALTVLPAPRGKVGLRVQAADYAALEAIAQQADIPLIQPARASMIKLRVSAEEYAALEAKAEEAGISVTALLRDHVGKVRIRDRETERRRVGLLNRINANLNMIAKWVNTHKGAADTVSVMAHIVALEAEITRLLEAQERT